MFNLEKTRTGNFDNLQPWGIYELTEEAVTTDGKRCAAGTEFWFEYAIVDMKAREALVHGSTPAGDPLVFATHGDEHRRLFVRTGLEWRPRRAPSPPRGEAVASGGEAAWLAARPEFARASALVAGARSSGNWGAAREDADTLRAAALSLEHSQPEVARWLADRALSFYHSWMSQATSGGEGTAMEYEVRNQLADMRRLLARP